MKIVTLNAGICGGARWLAILPMLVAVGCSETNPVDSELQPGVITMDIVSGNGQSAAARTELPSPLVVRVVNASGQPVPNQIVNFHVTQGGGSVFAGAALTNGQGIAQERWTLGAVGPQAIEARAVDSNTGTKQVFATFQATATDPATTVASVSVSPATATLTVGQTRQITPTATSESGQTLTGRSYTWSSSNTSVATVSASGVVTAVAAGSTTITASTGGRTGSATITVSANTTTAPAAVTNLRVSSVTATSVTLQWTQVSNGAGGAANYAIRYGSPTINWSAAYSTEVTVSGTQVGQTATYTITGLPAGTAHQFQLVSYRGTLNSNAVFGPVSSIVSSTTSAAAPSPPAVARVTATPSTYTFTSVGQVAQISAISANASGQTVSGTTYSYSSTNSNVVSVDAMGRMTARGAGTAMIIVTAACCTASDTVNAEVRLSSSGSGSGATSAIFSDSFESGDLRYNNSGYRWTASNAGSGDAVGVSNAIARTGSRSLRFLFGGESNLCADAFAEQRFQLGEQLREVWFEYYIYLPDGTEGLGARYESRTPSCPSNGDAEGINSNNKFFDLWDDDYNRYHTLMGFSTRSMRNGSGAGQMESSWGSDFFQSGSTSIPSSRTVDTWHRTGTGAAWTDGSNISNAVFGPQHLGRWVQIRIHVKLADNTSTPNGSMTLWVDGTPVIRRTNLAMAGASGHNYFRNGYIWGWSNTGFNRDTAVFVDDFQIFRSNPGW